MDKKEVRNQYKMTPPDMGIYQVRNKKNGKVLLGRALDLHGRLNSERFQLRNNLHMNRELQRDFNELGMENFSFDVLDRLPSKESPDHDHSQELKELEEMWLNKLQPYAGKGYNKKKL